MQVFTPVIQFFNRSDFFYYHGYGLTLAWIIGSTIGILFKKINIYLHALIFFIVDVSTLVLVSGAIYRYLPKFSSYAEWSLIRQLHVFGGLIVVVLILVQHAGGVITLYSQTKKNKQHRIFGFWVANLARVVVVFGWMLNGDKTNINYVSIASAVLLIASFYNAFLKKQITSKANHTQKVNPSETLKAKAA